MNWDTTSDHSSKGPSGCEASEISHWLSKSRDGDEIAFSKLYGFYICQLRTYIRGNLSNQDRAEGFDEDLSNECMMNIWNGLRKGFFTNATNRDELWYAMMSVAKSRSLDRRRYLRRKKRDFGIQSRLMLLLKGVAGADVASDEVDLMEVWGLFTHSLPNDSYRQIVYLKMEGHDIDEIASRMDSVPRSIRRKLEIVRRRWELFMASQNFS